MTDKRKMRIGPLNTVGRVATELGKLYRQARRGEIPVADASRLATVLTATRQALENNVEARLEALEQGTREEPRPWHVVQ